MRRKLFSKGKDAGTSGASRLTAGLAKRVQNAEPQTVLETRPEQKPERNVRLRRDPLNP